MDGWLQHHPDGYIHRIFEHERVNVYIKIIADFLCYTAKASVEKNSINFVPYLQKESRKKYNFAQELVPLLL